MESNKAETIRFSARYGEELGLIGRHATVAAGIVITLKPADPYPAAAPSERERGRFFRRLKLYQAFPGSEHFLGSYSAPPLHCLLPSGSLLTRPSPDSAENYSLPT
jgi:hypothetical protein